MGTSESFFCDTCDREIKKVFYYQDLDGKLLSPHGEDNDEYTVYFCGPKCSYLWSEKFGSLVNGNKSSRDT